MPMNLEVNRKQSLYFPAEMMLEIRAEADRQDRSLSWLMQQAWLVARGQLMQQPTSPSKATPTP